MGNLYSLQQARSVIQRTLSSDALLWLLSVVLFSAVCTGCLFWRDLAAYNFYAVGGAALAVFLIKLVIIGIRLIVEYLRWLNSGEAKWYEFIIAMLILNFAPIWLPIVAFVFLISRLAYIAENFVAVLCGIIMYLLPFLVVWMLHDAYMSLSGNIFSDNAYTTAASLALLSAGLMSAMLIILKNKGYSSRLSLAIMVSVPVLFLMLIVSVLGADDGGLMSADVVDADLGSPADAYSGDLWHGSAPHSVDQIDTHDSPGYHEVDDYYRTGPDGQEQLVHGHIRTNPDGIEQNNLSYRKNA